MSENEIEIAVKKFQNGYNCAQSVLYALADKQQISDEVLLKISTGFGGGMAREQEVCGAVTGGIMALGLKYGRGADDSKENTVLTYEKTRKLIAEFKDQYNTIICKELLEGNDLQTEEGQKNISENNLFEKTCVNCVKSVAEIYSKL